MILLAASTLPSCFNVTDLSTVDVVVLAVITTVACGANQIAQTMNRTNRTMPPPIKTNFLRKTLKSGTFGLPLPAGLAGFAGFVGFSSSAMAASIASSALFRAFGVALSANSPTGISLPSITSSPSSTSMAGISAISGRDCNVLATGIRAAAAKPLSAWSLVINTMRFSAFSAARFNNLILTALCNIPTRLGGTNATMRAFESFILLTMLVISSSTSI